MKRKQKDAQDSHPASRQEIKTPDSGTRKKVKVTNEELLGIAALNSWKLVIGRFEKHLDMITDEDLQRQVAPGRNRLFYLLGHLTAVHDRMFPLLGLGERLYPELDNVYITNPDGTHPDPVSAA